MSQGPGLIVEELEPGSALALHSTSHLPLSWRDKASLDWSWAFVLLPLDAGQRTRFLFRSRWVTAPWWFSLGGWLGIVPADFVMSRDMLNGVKQRAESLATQRTAQPAPAPTTRFRSAYRGALSSVLNGADRGRSSSTVQIGERKRDEAQPRTSPGRDVGIGVDIHANRHGGACGEDRPNSG